MTTEIYTLRWNEIKPAEIDSAPNEKDDRGLYLFLLEGIPFYVGTVEKSTFRNRLNTHLGNFQTGMRTMITSESTIDWPRFLKEPKMAPYWFVPGKDPVQTKEMHQQGDAFWMKLRILIARCNAEPQVLKAIETKMQLGLKQHFMNQYPELQLTDPDFRITPRSHFWGQPSNSLQSDKVHIEHDWSLIKGPPKNFFES